MPRLAPLSRSASSVLAALACTALLAACAHKPAPREQPRAEAALDRSHVPEGGPPREVELPPIQTFELPNGLRVALVERHELPLVSLRLLVLGAGTASDPKNLPGLANFTADMLDEGAGGLDAPQLARAIERLGAGLGTGAGSDAAFVSASGLSQVLDPLLGLLADVALKPAFAPADVARVKGEIQSDILRQRDQPPVVARLLFRELLYGAHPYGSRPQGTRESMTKVTREDARRFHAMRYVPQRSTLVVVGDVTREELEPKLAQAFGGWKAPEAAPAPSIPTPTESAGVRLAVFDKPGAPQSSLVVGLVGLERTSPDYIPATVMNAIFGGLFNSRLNMNLREDKHWAYGARSSFDARIAPGPFLIGAEIESAHTAAALREVLSEIERMRTTQVSKEELEGARNALIRSLPQRFETVSATGGAVADLFLYGLPLDYWDTFADRVLAVTPEQVQQMAQKYLVPDRLTIVIAGDRASIAGPLSELHLVPELEFRDAEGKRVE